MNREKTPYRLERLPVILPYHRRADNELQTGDLVYYGPCPEFYGIGEILNRVDKICIVDFRGTGKYGIHKDSLESKYLIPIHKFNFSPLLTENNSD